MLSTLATSLAQNGFSKGAPVIYRALLLNILVRADARAYGHAARRMDRLQQMSTAVLSPLPSHEDFVATLRGSHGRKMAFWSLVGRF